MEWGGRLWELRYFMFTVYIIYSVKLNKYYVGYTADIATRMLQNNTGVSRYTSKASDWVLKYMEQFEKRHEAAARERSIKAKKSRRYIELLISG